MSVDNNKTETMSNLSAIRHLTSGSLDSNQLDVAGRMSVDLINQIQLQIQSNKFEVNEVQKGFKLKQKSNNDSGKRINLIMNKKQEVQGQLSEIEKQESKLQQLNHTTVLGERKYFKSQITLQDIEKIKKIKMMQRKYEHDLENKIKIYQENLNRFKEEQKELLENQKRQKNQERLREVTKKIEEIRLRQEERNKKMEEQNKRIAQIKHQKKLYEKLEEQYKNTEQMQQRKKQELKLAWKQQRISKFGEIKEHEKKYDDIMRLQRQQREKKLGQLNRGNSKKYYQSKLLKDMLEEEDKAKREFVERKKEVKQMYIKKEEYAELVRNNHMPSVAKKEDQEESKTNNLGSRSFSVVELYKLGNDYMKQAHDHISNLKGSSVSKELQKKEEPFKYRNYLKEIRLQQKPTSHKESRYLEQIDNLMKKGNMTQEEKFHKAKLITKKIEEKKGQDSQKLIDSINAKIYLLKQIEP